MILPQKLYASITQHKHHMHSLMYYFLGIGYETALILASRGCRVIIADRKDATKVKEKIIEITQNNDIEVKLLDLTSLQSVRKFAKDITSNEERLDILINNAEVSSLGNKHTDDGLHATMQVNHFGPFLLTHLLTGNEYLMKDQF